MNTRLEDALRALDEARENGGWGVIEAARYELEFAVRAHLATPQAAQVPEAVSETFTLTLQEIIEVANFAGLHVTADGYEQHDLEAEYNIAPCPPGGVVNVGEPDDPDSTSHYARVVFCADYPEEGCIGLGPELAAAQAQGVES